MELRVDCLPGTAEPQTLWFGQRRVPVRAVLDRWWGAHQRWWKVDTEDGLYVLRRDDVSGTWDLAAVVRE